MEGTRCLAWSGAGVTELAPGAKIGPGLCWGRPAVSALASHDDDLAVLYNVAGLPLDELDEAAVGWTVLAMAHEMTAAFFERVRPFLGCEVLIWLYGWDAPRPYGDAPVVVWETETAETLAARDLGELLWSVHLHGKPNSTYFDRLAAVAALTDAPDANFLKLRRAVWEADAEALFVPVVIGETAAADALYIRDGDPVLVGETAPLRLVNDEAFVAAVRERGVTERPAACAGCFSLADPAVTINSVARLFGVIPGKEDIVRFYAVLEYIMQGKSSEAVRAIPWTSWSWDGRSWEAVKTPAEYYFWCSLMNVLPDGETEKAMWKRKLRFGVDGAARLAYQKSGRAAGLDYLVDATPRDAPPTAAERALTPFVEQAERFVARLGRDALFQLLPDLLLPDHAYPVYRKPIAPEAKPLINPKTLRPWTTDPRDKRHWRVRFDAFCTWY